MSFYNNFTSLISNENTDCITSYRGQEHRLSDEPLTSGVFLTQALMMFQTPSVCWAEVQCNPKPRDYCHTPGPVGTLLFTTVGCGAIAISW